MFKKLRLMISGLVAIGLIVSSNSVAFAAGDLMPPTAPQDLNAYKVAVGDWYGARLTWTASTDNVGVNKYVITRTDMNNNGQRTFFTVAGNQTQYDDLMFRFGAGAIVGMFYSVSAYDVAGNVSDSSNDFLYTNQDLVAPSAPTNLTATEVTVGNQYGVRLNWTAATDHNGVTEYHIYRINNDTYEVMEFIVPGDQTTFNDLMFPVGTGAVVSLTYTVTAYDAVGNVSQDSNHFTYNTPTSYDPEMGTLE